MQSDAGLHRGHLRGYKAAETNSNQAANHASRMKRELCLRRYKTIFVLFFRDCPRAASPSPAICFNLLQLCSGYFLKAQCCGTYREWGAFARMHRSTSPLRMPYNLQNLHSITTFYETVARLLVDSTGTRCQTLICFVGRQWGLTFYNTIVLVEAGADLIHALNTFNIWPNRFVSIQLLDENACSRLGALASKGFQNKLCCKFLRLSLVL